MTPTLSLFRAAALAGAAWIALAATSGIAAAQSGTQDEQRACTPDVFRLCASFIPDENRIVACLRRDLSRLSPGCRQVFAPKPSRKRVAAGRF